MRQLEINLPALQSAVAIAWEAGRAWQKLHGGRAFEDTAGWYLALGRLLYEYVPSEPDNGEWCDFVNSGVTKALRAAKDTSFSE